MLRRMSGQRGQSVSTEYVIIFFVAVAAVGAMAIYVRRAFQARAFDAQTFMIKRAAQALDNAVPFEYEPYYAQVESNIDESSTDKTRIHGQEIFTKDIDVSKTVTSSTLQKPPAQAR